MSGPAQRPPVPLPPESLRLMGDDDDTFRAQADSLAALVYRMGLRDDDALIDVGCGVGRLAIGLVGSTPFDGRYVGFDVMPLHVGWARETLGRGSRTLHFRHVDAVNDRYNPPRDDPCRPGPLPGA